MAATGINVQMLKIARIHNELCDKTNAQWRKPYQINRCASHTYVLWVHTYTRKHRLREKDQIFSASPQQVQITTTYLIPTMHASHLSRSLTSTAYDSNLVSCTQCLVLWFSFFFSLCVIVRFSLCAGLHWLHYTHNVHCIRCLIFWFWEIIYRVIVVTRFTIEQAWGQAKSLNCHAFIESNDDWFKSLIWICGNLNFIQQEKIKREMFCIAHSICTKSIPFRWKGQHRMRNSRLVEWNVRTTFHIFQLDELQKYVRNFPDWICCWKHCAMKITKIKKKHSSCVCVNYVEFQFLFLKNEHQIFCVLTFGELISDFIKICTRRGNKMCIIYSTAPNQIGRVRTPAHAHNLSLA